MRSKGNEWKNIKDLNVAHKAVKTLTKIYSVVSYGIQQQTEIGEIGDQFFKVGKFHEACEKYTEALEIRTEGGSLVSWTTAKLLSKRAKCYNAMRIYKKCIQDYETALEMSEDCRIELALKEVKRALKRYTYIVFHVNIVQIGHHRHKF